jgi:hypothetical protein
MPLVVAAQGYLENPQPMAYESGINIVSGWHCTAREITVFIDGVSLGKSGVGSIRNDTVGICGHANTGFSLLYNYNIPEPGEHEIAVYADGALLERRNFTTVRSGGVPFLSGRSATATIADFPESGRSTTVEWSQAKQSFVVVGSADTSTLDGTYSLRRASIQTQNSGLLDTAETNGIEVSGTMVVSGNSYRQSLMVSLGDSSPPVPIEVMGNLQDRGYYLYDRANGNQIVIVERGAAMITSLLYTAPDWGWTNEIDYWVKTR